MLLIVLILMIIQLSPASVPEASQPDFSKIGVHLLLDDGRNHWDQSLWASHMHYAGLMSGEGGIAVQVIGLDQLDSATWQPFIDLSVQNNLTPVIRIATTFDSVHGFWKPPQPDTTGSFVPLADRYARFINALNWHGLPRHIILLNEPNNGHEWAGRPDPAAYAHFLVDTASTLKSSVPDVVILNGAFDLYAPDTGNVPFPGSDLHFINASNFMDGMIAAEPDVFSWVDVWSSHPYAMGSFTLPPWECAYHFDSIHDAPPVTSTPPEGIMNRGINGYEWELWKLSTYGIDPLPVMLTETGWRHSGGGDTAYPSPETVAAYLDMAMLGNADGRYPDAPRDGWTPWLLDDRVTGIALFALNGAPFEWAHTSYLALDNAGNVLDTYPMFDLLAGY